jgi:hypothetical protein
MKKQYIVGALVLVGAISLIAWYQQKPKKNSDGFFNASGCGCSGN